MDLRASTGGYDLASIEGSGKLWILFQAKARANGARVFGRLVVRLQDPEHITLLDLAPADSNSARIVLDEAERNRVIAGAELSEAQSFCGARCLLGDGDCGHEFPR